MPQGVVFTDKEMFPFFEKMERGLGFKILSKDATIAFIKQNLFPLPLVKQKDKRGLETCLFWQSPFSFLSVYVWTSYIEREKKVREKDSGWVLIVYHRPPIKEVAFFCFPRRRTKNFLNKLYNDAYACTVLATQWARKCPICGWELKLELKRADKLHEVHFVCPVNKKHKLFDDRLCQNITDPTVQKLLLSDMEQFHKYQKRNFERGIKHTPRRIIRAMKKANKEAGHLTQQTSKPRPNNGVIWDDTVYGDLPAQEFYPDC